MGFQYNNILEKSMMKVAIGLSEEERKTISFGGLGDEWTEKLKELEKLSKGHCLFEGLGNVVGIFEGKEEVGEDEVTHICDESDDKGSDGGSDSSGEGF